MSSKSLPDEVEAWLREGVRLVNRLPIGEAKVGVYKAVVAGAMADEARGVPDFEFCTELLAEIMGNPVALLREQREKVAELEALTRTEAEQAAHEAEQAREEEDFDRYIRGLVAWLESEMHQPCAYCGEEFEAGTNRKYCGPTCRRRAAAERRRRAER